MLRKFLLKIEKLKKSRKIILIVSSILLIFYFFITTDQLFSDPYSMVLEDKNGKLLGAHIAKDGQWRFPHSNEVPNKFGISITTFEDKRFNYHWGFDIIAFGRALWKNISSMKVVSGGSTITMQVIRLSRKNKSRTFWEKFIEIILATRIEFSYSKNKILSFYASNAPFGGNVVGLDAASWRYFGRKPNNLSWAESAMLAVLPNSPGLIHPGRNRKDLFNKRNRLLKKLLENKVIDSTTYELSIEEEIPEKPKAFPQTASHLLFRAFKENKSANVNNKIKTTIDIEIQKKVNRIVSRHNKTLLQNSINNLAALVIDVKSGDVVAYTGNIVNSKKNQHGNKVDIIMADRSTGSILKPFLYAAMLTSGEILPEALVLDIPIHIKGYTPQNYNMGYDGAVPAKRALARSLNVPAVRLLMRYKVARLHYLLKKIGLTSINKPPSHYGLSLILGGCEGKLWDLCGIYASMARTLNNYTEYDGKYNKADFYAPNYLFENSKTIQEQNKGISGEVSWFSAAALWLTFNAMLDVERPDDENSWKDFSSSQPIAWKTGTSFGFRDAWAIGVTPDYVVGVWAGNADGEGRPGLVGVKSAAPVLFDIFDIMPVSQNWFEQPIDEMIEVNICEKSGYLASDICEPQKKMWIPEMGERFMICPYHKIIHLSADELTRVHSDCESTNNMVHKSWFVLPPAVEWYYKSKNSNYVSLPPYRNDCKSSIKTSKSMEIIYPKELTKIYIPTELDGKTGGAVFEVAHRNPNATIFWHIDNEYVGETRYFHHISVNADIGKHKLTLVDENGETITQEIEMIGEE